ncbi:ATP-dependent zinc metalloprotease FtsH [Selenomonas ruminis]|uniref:ATP-dependent zinc metalloprotease FtsH n=1 Tax=Selenomonas ruminis TaxID=2593411 RepID=A0A5D6WA16_9FIRM|nr:ATP-dependent zinc metalloprotease FtsH [Selenomonas sp. mPRGC5]TYZ23464.1 ATP-dependent zinc metalloprotease FtsH [Selenomonas sp. mPRGC5]
MNKFLRNVGFYLLIILVAISIIDYFSTKNTTKQEIEYTQFLQQVDNGEVSKVVIIQNTIRGKLSDGTEFTTITPDAPNNDPQLYQKLSSKNVEIAAENPPEPPWWSTMFSSVLPILLLVGVWFFIMQQTQGGGGRVMSFGKSRARMSGADKIKVNFKDVAGADEAKQELEEVVEFLKHPKKYNDLGARIPKGVLLFGPPGTGKTLLARAVAGEAGVPFFSISGSDFVEMFVGVGASRVRDLFDQAKKNAPCIVFIDEIDAVGRQRGAGVGGGHDEREQTLNQLLVEMDGFAANEGIIIIAATNRPDILDPALLRPGRFDRQIVVDKPDVRGRLAILKVHTKGKPVAEDADLDILARRTPGFTGADLSNLVNEAALLAARRDKKKIFMQELEEAIERVMAGPERKSHIMNDEEKRLTAYHEGGHTLVGMMLKHADPVHKVTIIPRGRAGGYTLMLPKEDRNYATKSELLDRLKVAMGGRVAEEIVLKEISTGASQDIQQATRMVRGMVMQYGMSDVLGPVAYGESQNHQVFLGRDINHERNYSEEVASEIDKEVRKYLEEAYEACREIITENRDKLELIAQALMERETLTAKQLEELLTTGKLADDEEKNTTDSLNFEKKKDDWSFFDPAPVGENEQQDDTDAASKEKEDENDAAEEKTDAEKEDKAEPKFNVTHYDR